MCGRYASFREAQDLADHFAVADDDVAEDARLLPPSWNVAPTDAVRIVVERDERRRGRGSGGGSDVSGGEQPDEDEVRRSLRLARWGLVPSWAKDPKIGSRMINARVETLADKPAFKRAVVSRRCLVPAEGWFEWQAPPADAGAKAPKQPFWLHHAEGEPLAFAGLYEFWRDPAAADDDPHRWLVTVTIVTGGVEDDDPALAAIHDRRPVVLTADRWDAWLDPRREDPAEAVRLLHGPLPPVVATPVGTAVNRVGTNGPELVEPAGEDVEPDTLF